MLLNFLDGQAIMHPFYDGEGDVGGGNPPVVNPAPTSTEPVVDSGAGVQPNNTALEFEIEGVGKVKSDEIREWKLGYMRQSDYTRKTQELAKQRTESKEALELYNFFKNNPQMAQAVRDGDTTALKQTPIATVLNKDNHYEDVTMRLASIELDNQINTLKTKYPDFNEVEVLNEADRLGIADLEFIYNGLQGKRLPNLVSEITKRIESQLTEKIRQNGIATQTIISTNDVITDANHGLSDVELTIATKMGLTPEQYAKGKAR